MPSLGRAIRRLLTWVTRRPGTGGRSDEPHTMLTKTTVEEFAQQLAAGTPTPGGGSASALAGALSASLVQMVCDLTLGKEKYRQHEDAVRSIRQRAEALRRDLLILVDRDAEAYDAVVRALRLPKGTEAERRSRGEALARANLFATETPIATADACAALMALAIELAHKGNLNAVSDVGAAALLAYAGLRGGVMNVRANLKGIESEEHAARLRDRIRRLEMDAERRREEALAAVYSRTR